MNAWTKMAAALLCLVCCAVGCDKKRPASAYEDPKRERAEQIAAAKKAYSAFADDVTEAIKYLEAGQWTSGEDAYNKLKEQNEKLHKKLADAKSVAPAELKKFKELQQDGDNLMKLLGGPVETAHFQVWERKESPPDRQAAAVRKGVEMNINALRQTLDGMKARIESSSGETKTADKKS